MTRRLFSSKVLLALGLLCHTTAAICQKFETAPEKLGDAEIRIVNSSLIQEELQRIKNKVGGLATVSECVNENETPGFVN